MFLVFVSFDGSQESPFINNLAYHNHKQKNKKRISINNVTNDNYYSCKNVEKLIDLLLK